MNRRFVVALAMLAGLTLASHAQAFDYADCGCAAGPGCGCAEPSCVLRRRIAFGLRLLPTSDLR